ncbi:MAG: hypothetical protein ACXVB1_00125 [Pseudobdellovibrionaceae bacterium]
MMGSRPVVVAQPGVVAQSGGAVVVDQGSSAGWIFFWLIIFGLIIAILWIGFKGKDDY